MKRERDWLVGLTVVAALLAVVLGAIWLGELDVRGGKGLHTARFKTVGGLKVGAPVTVRGVKVGQVMAVRLAPGDWVDADLSIERKVELPAKPAVIAASSSLFGEWQANIMALEPLPDDPQVRADLLLAERASRADGAWPGATLPDIGELTAQASRIAQDVANVTNSIQNVLDTAAVRELKGSIADLSNISKRLANVARAAAPRLDTVGQQVAVTSGAFQRTALRLDSATSDGALQALMANGRAGSEDFRKAAADLRELMAAARENKQSLATVLQSADSILRRFEQGQGTLGMLARDSTLYVEATATLKDLRALIADVRANPKRYLKISVF